jgi:hypothetical protein
MLLRNLLGCVIINGYNLTVGSLHTAGVANIPSPSIVAKNDLQPPGLAIVLTNPCSNPLWLPTITISRAYASIRVGDAQPPIPQPHKAGWVSIALTRVSHLAQELPRPSIILRLVNIYPAFPHLIWTGDLNIKSPTHSGNEVLL